MIIEIETKGFSNMNNEEIIRELVKWFKDKRSEVHNSDEFSIIADLKMRIKGYEPVYKEQLKLDGISII